MLLFLQGLRQPVFCDSKFNQNIMLHQCRSRISALVACRLVALDKNPGIRPIGIGETLRRLIGKAILCIVQRTAGSLQGPAVFPARSGGLGIIQPTNTAFEQIGVSKKVTEPLVSIIPQQSISYPDQIQADQHQAKKAVCNCNHIAATTEAETIKQKLSSSQQVAMDQASWRGASSWLTAIPIAEYKFTLYKQAFQDALCIRYGWRPA